ncbi:hypothetical protein, partial [Geodermatophilus sp. SYSU D00815]
RPLLVGARSVHVGIKPNDDPAKEITDRNATGRLLEWLVFDALKCDPGTAHVRDLVSFHGGELLDHEREDEARTRRTDGRGSRTGEPDVADLVARIQDAGDDDELREVWVVANRSALLQVDVETPGGNYTLAELIQARHEEFLEASVQAHPAGRRASRAGTPASAAVVDAARTAAARPAAGREAKAPQPLLVSSPNPDDPKDCRVNAARRGVLASLESLGVSGDDIADRFGRPAEQVATKRLSALVRDVISSQRADGQQEIA